MVFAFKLYLDSEGIKYHISDEYMASLSYFLPYVRYDVPITLYGEYDLEKLAASFAEFGRGKFAEEQNFKAEIWAVESRETQVMCSTEHSSGNEAWVVLRLNCDTADNYSNEESTGIEALESVSRLEPVNVANIALAVWLAKKIDTESTHAVAADLLRNVYEPIEAAHSHGEGMSWLISDSEDDVSLSDFLESSDYWEPICTTIKSGEITDDTSLCTYLSEYVSKIVTDLCDELCDFIGEERFEPFEFHLELDEGLFKLWSALAFEVTDDVAQ